MKNFPNTITMDGEEKVVSVYDLRGYFKWVVCENLVLVDQKYLDELFSSKLS